jgi:uncharacterized lipoprotein YddW (UPF0748 family)
MPIRLAAAALAALAICAAAAAQPDVDADAWDGADVTYAENPAPTATADPDELLARADAAYAARRREEALKLYEQVIAARPGNARARSRVIELKSILSEVAPAPSSDRPAAPAAAAQASGGAQPTAKGKAGSTPATESMPLDVAGLTALRQRFTNQPEYRAAWITRFDWASPNPQQVRNKIASLIQQAQDINLNMVFFQVRAEAATLYPSELEPWSRLLGGDPGFDPLEFALEEAHKRGLKLHAYFNPCPASDDREGPKDPKHIWTRHCTPEANPNWLVYQDGKVAPFEEYWWLNVNLPEVQSYIRATIVDLVTRYPIDGLHFDRIRFPNSKVSDDPWSKARHAGDGNPAKLEYAAWQRDNLARMLTDIYGVVGAMRPKMPISASVWGIYDKTKLPQGGQSEGYSWTSSGLQDYQQDSIGWINSGCMDILVPMIYWDMGGNKPDYDELVADFRRQITSGRHMIGGQKVFGAPEMIRQAAATSLLGAQGTCPFTLSRVHQDGLAEIYRRAIHPNRVEPPGMPWKDSPTVGIVLVTVRRADGAPVMDAHVRLPGRDYVWLSSADGFCAIIDAAPGAAVVTAQKAGMGSGQAQVAVQPGQAVRAEIILR